MTAPEHPAVLLLAVMLNDQGHPYDIGRDLVDEVQQPGDRDSAWPALEALLTTDRLLSIDEDEDSDFARAVAWACTHYLLGRVGRSS